MRTTGPGIFIWIALLLALQGKAQFYAGSQMEFGKNRIQYHPFDWSFYRYERFDVFFYVGGKENALQVAQNTAAWLPKLEQRFNYGLETRLQILIFNRLSDLKQSNLGTGLESAQSLGGTARQHGNKILLFMEDGNTGLQRQLREGIASAMVNELLFGTDLRNRIRSNAFMYIPDWYVKGLVSWMADGWDTGTDEMLREGLLTGRYKYPTRVAGEDANVVGKSIWNYIASVYGEKIIPDILDMAHLSRNIDGGFRYVLGLKLSAVIAEWKQYYGKYFSEPDTLFNPGKSLLIKQGKRSTVISAASISKDGKHIAWVENNQGRADILIRSTSGNEIRKIARIGRRLPDITDYSFPQIAWHPSNELLVFTDEWKGRIRLNFYNHITRQTDRKFLEFFSKVTAIDISPDGRSILMCAIRNGKSDVFVFNNVSNTIEQISDDGFDEAGARWFPDGSSLIFSSNRNTDSLKTSRSSNYGESGNAHDLFIYQPKRDRLRCLRLSNTPLINEKSPVPIDNRSWVFTSDKSGLINRYLGETDSAITHVDTIIHYRYFMKENPLSNLNRNLLCMDVNQAGAIVEVTRHNGRYRLATDQVLPVVKQPDPVLTAWGRSLQPAVVSEKRKKTDEEQQPQGKIKKIVVFGKDRQQETAAAKASVSADTLKPTRQRVYFTSWYTEQFSTRIGRAFLNQSYQPYTGQTGYINPPLNGLFKIALSDLFEDYRITAGIRLAGNFSGNEYLLAFQDQKQRLDKTYSFHRQVIQESAADDARLLVHTLSARYSWPFSPVSRLSGTLAYRNDRKIYLSTDLSSLRKPTEIAHWVQPRIEYVFDNTFPASRNMMTGTRLKVTTEFFFRTSGSNRMVGIIGADIRHYVRLARETIFAIRLAGAGSFGSGKLLFLMGGVDNWFNPQSLPTKIDQKQPYVFQTLATNLRGFSQNIRNGNNFGVLNAECRWNPVRFFSHYPLKSDLLNTLQLISFFDMGTAFTGPHPWSEKNTFNQTIISNGPITVILKNLNNPLVYGAGLGLRAKIFGYFVRFDYAKGLLNGKWQPRMLYLSFCTDF